MTVMRSPISAMVAALLIALTSKDTSAQTVLARVVDGESGRPVIGALVHLVAPGGEAQSSTLTDDLGRALFVGVLDGSIYLRAEMIGQATTETALFSVGHAETVSLEIRMEPSAILLEGIDVSASERCEIRGGEEGMVVAEVWNEARKALLAASITDNRGLYRYETMRYDRDIDAETDAVLSE